MSVTEQRKRALENATIRFKYQFQSILRSQYNAFLAEKRIKPTEIKLGEGAFGIAYKAIQQKTIQQRSFEQEIVIKHISEQGIKSETAIIKELLITDKVSHEFLVQTFHCLGPVIEDDQTGLRQVQEGEQIAGFYLIQDFVHGGTLDNYFEQIALGWDLDQNEKSSKKIIKGQVAMEQIRTWMRQILQAFHYLPCSAICHRDMHKANIMFDLMGTVKIIDFGQSEKFRTVRKLFAPELQDSDSDFYTPDELTASEDESAMKKTAATDNKPAGKPTTSEIFAQMMMGKGRGKPAPPPQPTTDNFKPGDLAPLREPGSPYKEVWKIDLYGFNDNLYRLSDIFAYMLHVSLSDVTAGQLIVSKGLSFERQAEILPALAFGRSLYRASTIKNEADVGHVIRRGPLAHHWLAEDDILEKMPNSQLF